MTTAPAMPELPDSATVLPDGSAFAIASFPLPSDHWLYAPREYRDGEEEPIELPSPILSHQAHGDVVRAAIRYAVRSATMCGKEPDFDPDALVQNAMYALCGPFGGATLQAQPAEMSDAELLDAYNSIDPCNESPQDRLIRRLRAILALRPQSESEQEKELRRSLAEAQATISERNVEIIELQKRIHRSPQAVPMTDGCFTVGFNLTENKLPKLVSRSTSYGGVWMSALCLVIGKDGYAGVSRLEVADSVKADLDAGKHIPRTRGTIKFKGPASDRWDNTCVAWAYLEDVKTILASITAPAGGEG